MNVTMSTPAKKSSEKSNLILTEGGNPFGPDAELEETLLSPSDAVESCLHSIGVGRFHYVFLVAVGLCFGAEAQQIFLTTFIRHQVEAEFSVSSTDAATMVTALFCGIGIGSMGFGVAADAVGRRLVSILSLLICGIFGICAASSANFAMLEVSLFFMGIGCGGGFIVVALFMELLPAESRETWCSVAYSMWTWGTLLQCLWAYLLRDESWRWLTAITAVPLLLTLLFAVKIPESPRYLLMKGEHQAAYDVIKRLARVNKKPLPLEAKYIMIGSPVVMALSSNSSISSGTESPKEVSANMPQTPPPSADGEKQEQDPVEQQPNQLHLASPGKKFLVLFSPKFRRLTLSMWMVWGGAAASYYGIIMLTTSVFLKGAGGGGNGEGFAAVAFAACGELPVYPLLRICTQKMGRRLPLIIFPLVTAVLLVIFFFTLQPDHEATLDNWKFVAELLLAFIIRLFVLLCFDIAYMFSPEAFPTAIRTTGTGSCSGIARVTSMLTPFVAYPLQAADPFAPYVIFALLLAATAIGAYFVPFDTKGKTMDDSIPQSPEAATAENRTAEEQV